MRMKSMVVLLIFAAAFLNDAGCQKPGIQMRITKKGFDYGMQAAMTRVRREITKMNMDQHGRAGKVEYWLSNFRVRNVQFPHTVLRPISNVGVEVNLKGISLSGGGHLRYSYHTGIFGFKVNGAVGFSINLHSVQTYTQVVFGKDGRGRPTIGLRQCWSNIGSVGVSFHGGGILGWIMNLFRGQIGNMAKGMLTPFICQQVRGKVISGAAASLRGFPVTQRIDNTVNLDYHCVATPKYTNDYMDLFLKGQFQCSIKPSTHLVPNSFPVNGDHAKMLYLWVSDYALDTAGEAYQKSGLLSLSIESWKAKIPDSRLAEILQLKTFIKMIPDLSKLGNCPVAVYARSYKAPSINIKANGVHGKVFVEVNLKMKQGEKITPLFGCQVNVSAVVQPRVNGNSLTGKITDFDFKHTITSSFTGKIDLTPPPEFREIISSIVLGAVNPALQKGFPLPKTREISFRSTNFKLYDGAIRVGTDIWMRI